MWRRERPGHDDIEPTGGERIDAMEFVAWVLVYPAVYLLWRWHTELRHEAAAVQEP